MDPERADMESESDRPEGAEQRGVAAWLHETNRRPGLVDLIRRARRVLPGDPDFGDPLSMAGDSGPQAAARLLGDRDAASREVSLAGLQVWQALTERVSGIPANGEVTIVFTDLVGFSAWSLRAGDDATLRLLRQVSAAVEPPLLNRGGYIVKRLGDGIMAVFAGPAIAVAAVLAARDAVREVEVDGYTPRMRFGVHTGRPQRVGGDWLGVDVNIAARVMERATRGGVMISGTTLDLIGTDGLEAMGVTAQRVRKQVFGHKSSGVPADLVMYRLQTRRAAPGEVAGPEPDETGDDETGD